MTLPPDGATARTRSRYLSAADAAALKRRAAAEDFPSWSLDGGQLAELELLLSGALAPLGGYLSRADGDRVRAESRLADGTPWPRPLQLAVGGDVADRLRPDQPLALRDAEGVLIAVLTVTERWSDTDGVRLAGPVAGVEPPVRYDFPALRDLTTLPPPDGARLGLITATPLTPARLETIRRCAADLDAEPVIGVCVGAPAVDDPRHYALVRYQTAALRRFLAAATLRLLPLAAPRRDADFLLAARVMANLGCSHLLLDDDRPETLADAVRELGIEPCTAAADTTATDPAAGAAPLPAELARELALIEPPRAAQGVTIFFTGLSGSGKSTVANALLGKLLATTRRSVTLLDGDRVRQHLSGELGFSRRDRDVNILRIGYVASEITKHGGIAVCAPIAPYAATREAVRAMVERHGGFVEVHVATPLEICERRDRKGLYAKARAGLIKEFTGVSDPYETPERPELRLDTAAGSAADAADRVLAKLTGLGYLTSS